MIVRGSDLFLHATSRLEEERRADEALHARVVVVVGECKGKRQSRQILRARRDSTLLQVAEEAMRVAGLLCDAPEDLSVAANLVRSIWKLGPRTAALGAWRPEQRLDPSALVSKAFAAELGDTNGMVAASRSVSAGVSSVDKTSLCAFFVDTVTDQEPEAIDSQAADLTQSVLIIFKQVVNDGRALVEIGRQTCSIGTTVDECYGIYHLLLSDYEGGDEMEVSLFEEIAPGSLAERDNAYNVVSNGTILVGVPISDDVDTADITGWTLWSQELFETYGETEDRSPDASVNYAEQHGSIAQWFALQDSVSVKFVRFDDDIGRYKEPEQLTVSLIEEKTATFQVPEQSDDDATDGFQLRLSKSDTYDDIAQIVASRLGVEQPLSLHFYAARVQGEAPVRCSRLRDGGVLLKLEDMLRVHHHSVTTLLYCEGQYTIAELETSAGLAMFALFLSSGQPAQREPLQLLVGRGDTVGVILRRLVTSLPAGFLRSAGGDRASRLRLVSTQHGRVRRLYSVDDTLDVADLQSWGGITTTTLRVEEMQAVELRARVGGELPGVGWKLVYCYHCELSQPVAKLFGEPLLLIVAPEDSVAVVKDRVKEQLRVDDEDFASWNFHVLQHAQSTPLDDGANLMALLDHQADGASSLAPGEGPKTLGMEHIVDGTAIEDGSSNKRPRIFKASTSIKIWG